MILNLCGHFTVIKHGETNISLTASSPSASEKPVIHSQYIICLMHRWRKIGPWIWNILGQQGAVVWHTVKKSVLQYSETKINKWQWPYIQLKIFECVWSETSWSANSLDDSEDTPSFVAETAAAELLGYTSSSLCLCLPYISNKKKKLSGMKRSTLIYLD